ncbi:MAG: DNA-3-methyladenine glycosylase I [Acidimicrobiia bacterium]|nr:DNA-3-methyladenine glycosylase I [Acidimicrobiia bacterium]
MNGLVQGSDGKWRCWWGTSPDIYVDYHDTEWGRPVLDDDRLYEKMCLEGFQAGLSWLTILNKRKSFRAAFAGFRIADVAAFDERDVDRLLADAGIVRHRGKIEAAIGNARAALEVQESEGSLAALVWSFEPSSAPPLTMAEVLAVTPDSTAMSKELKKRGFRFVGPTTMHALMQAMGLVNEHIDGCWVRDEVEAERQAAAHP